MTLSSPTNVGPLAPGTTVQWRRDIGVVRQVLGSGHAYRVQFPDGQEFVCLAAVLNPAPSNITVFRKREPNPYAEMYEL